MVRLDTIAIPTARRPGVLVRCVESYVEQARRSGRALRFVIADDGTESEQATTRDAVHDLVRRTSAVIEYLGLAEKAGFVRRLTRAADVPADLLSFAFFDSERTRAATHGANRNLLLAHEAGRALLMVDDDTVGACYRPPDHREEVRIRRAAEGATGDPSDCWPARTDAEAYAWCRAVRIDSLGEYERWLGRPADAGHGDPAGLRAQARAARTAIAVSGLVGDCGWGSPSTYLFLRGPSLARLTASGEHYEACTASRSLVRAVSQPTIGARADDFMSTCFGIDGQTLLPPFPPVCRGSDRVFARLLAICCPRSWFAHLPLVVAHRPAKARRFWRGEITRSAAGIDLSMLLCALLEMLATVGGDGEPIDRFAWCGTWLERVATGPAPAFEAAAAAAVRQMLDRQIVQLEQAAASPDVRADGFRRDASAYIVALRRTCARADFFVPLDLRGTRSVEDACALTRAVVQQFGRLLRHWPRIVRAARGMAHESLTVER